MEYHKIAIVHRKQTLRVFIINGYSWQTSVHQICNRGIRIPIDREISFIEKV